MSGVVVVIEQDTLVIEAAAAHVVEVTDQDTLVVTEPPADRETLVIVEPVVEVVELSGGARGPAGPAGPPGEPGESGGVSLPMGGTAGQMLTKASSADGDATWDSLPAPMKVQLNKQAYAGGPYRVVNYVNRGITAGRTTHLPVVDTFRPPGVEAQRLAADGWSMTGKGGLFRLRVYVDFYTPREVAPDETVSIFVIATEAGGSPVFAENFRWPPDTYGQQVLELWLSLADTFGVLQWQIEMSTSKGTSSVAWPIAPYVVFDLDRVAGWPIA